MFSALYSYQTVWRHNLEHCTMNRQWYKNLRYACIVSMVLFMFNLCTS